MEKADKHHLSQMIKVNTNSGEPCWQYVSLIWCDEKGTLPLWSSSQNPQTQSNHEKNIKEISIEGRPSTYQTSPLQNCYGHPRKESL